MKEIREIKPFYIANLILIIIAVFSRCYLYIQNYDLWIDDTMQSTVIWYNSFADIFKGNLYYDQAPALLFTLVVKLLAIPFGDSEYVLRFVPFVFGIAIFPLAYIFSVKNFNEKFAFIFLFLLVSSDCLLFYSVQFKEYSAAAFFSLLLLHLYLIYRKNILNTAIIPWKIMAVSIVACMFINSMFFVVLSIFLCLLYEQFKNKNILLFIKQNAFKLLIFITFSFLYYRWASSLLKDDFMNISWFKHGNFSFFNFLSYFMDFTYNYYINAILFLVLFLSGMFFLFRKKFILFLQIAIIFGMCIAMHILHIYPLCMQISFSKIQSVYPIYIRTSLFLIPFLMISVAFALERIFVYCKFKKAFAGIFILFFGVAIYTNGDRLQKGTEIYHISRFVDIVNHFSTENSAIIIDNYIESMYLYKQHRHNKIADTIYIIETFSKEKLYGTKEKYPETNARYFASENMLANDIFNFLEEKKKTELFFFFSPLARSKTIETANYAKNNYPEENVFIHYIRGIFFISVKVGGN